MASHPKQLVFALLVVVHVVLDLALPQLSQILAFAFMVPFGVWVSQLTLVAMTWAWQPALAWRARSLQCAALGAAGTLASFFGVWLTSPSLDFDELVGFIGMAMLVGPPTVGLFLMQLLLLIGARRLLGVRIQVREVEPVPGRSGDSQFSIRDLLVLTAVIGFLLAVVPMPFVALLSANRNNALSAIFAWAIVITLSALAIGSLLVAFLTALAAFSKRPAAYLGLVALLIVLALVLLGVWGEDLGFVALIASAMFSVLVTTALSILIVRACGYELGRRRPRLDSVDQ